MEAINDDISILRDILARELETINSYQNLLACAKSSEVREFIAHIIEEEKEHVAESMELIKELDPAQAAWFEEGSHWKKDSLLRNSTHPPKASITHADPDNRVSPFTVGSLRLSKQQS